MSFYKQNSARNFRTVDLFLYDEDASIMYETSSYEIEKDLGNIGITVDNHPETFRDYWEKGRSNDKL